jgi:PAS domain S-box-containing protein
MENKNNGSRRQAHWPAVAVTCQEMLSVIPAAAYTCDASGLITYFNAHAEAVWGRAPKLRDASDRYCGSYQLYSTDGAPIRHVECWMALALQQGTAYHGREIVIERRDGTRIICEAHAHPLRNDLGQIVGGLNLIADITGQRIAAGSSKPYLPSTAHSATLAMINTAVSVLTAMILENANFN